MKIALFITGLLIFTVINHRDTSVNSKIIYPPISRFVGKWYWTPDKSEVFSLEIKQAGNQLIGSYCDVFDNGKKMDCADANDTSFTTSIPKSNSIITKFVSSYGHAQGRVQLNISGNKLIWKVIKRPKGINYCPSVVVMKKDKA